MSFGRPGGFGDTFKVSPPQRGSFPLDHDGDCKEFMMKHLKCMTENAGDVGKCRLESRRYLECRMDHNLMAREEMVNLGLGDVGTDNPIRPAPPGVPGASGAHGAQGSASTTVPPPSSSKPVNPSERI